MAKIASDSGLGRESLYKALKPEAKPRFETIIKVLKSLGVKIQFNAINKIDEYKEKKTKSSKAATKESVNTNQTPQGIRRKTKSIVKKST
jgi:hypothetical protein